MPGISDVLVAKALYRFAYNRGVWYSSARIQKEYMISRTSACKLLKEVGEIIPLEEKKEGRTPYFRLPVDSDVSFLRLPEVLLTLTEEESVVLSILLRIAESDPVLGCDASSILHKLSSSGVLSSNPDSIPIRVDSNEYRLHTKGNILAIVDAIRSKSEIIIETDDSTTPRTVVPTSLYLDKISTLKICSNSLSKNETILTDFVSIKRIDKARKSEIIIRGGGSFHGRYFIRFPWLITVQVFC